MKNEELMEETEEHMGTIVSYCDENDLSYFVFLSTNKADDDGYGFRVMDFNVDHGLILNFLEHIIEDNPEFKEEILKMIFFKEIGEKEKLVDVEFLDIIKEVKF